MPMSRRKGGRSTTERPASRMAPESGCRKPAIRLSVVDLPQPDGPSKVRNSPGGTARSIPSTAAWYAKVLRMLWSSTAGSATDRASIDVISDPEEVLHGEYQQEGDHERDHRDGGKGRREPELDEGQDGDGDRLSVRAGEKQRDTVVGEGLHKGEGRAREDAALDQRQHHLHKNPARRRAEARRRVLNPGRRTREADRDGADRKGQ